MDRSRKHWGRWLRLAALLALASLPAGCALKKKVDLPVSREEVPKQEQAAPPAAAKPSQPEMRPERQEKTVPEPAPETPAREAAVPPVPGQTGALLASANKTIQAGQLDKAEMHLERALRLSPREPQLWHAMAQVRFAQGNYGQTVQFCLKSNSLAGKNSAVARHNWLLMEKAYLKSGDKEKAAQARQKAGENLQD